MSQLINGRTPESIKNTQDVCILSHDCNGKECPYYHQLGCVDASVKDALDLIAKLESERDEALAKTPKWIGVEERLPEDKVAVLGYGLRSKAYNKQDPFPAAHIVYTRGDGEGWFTFWNNEHVKVTHWMPLIEEPEECLND